MVAQRAKVRPSLPHSPGRRILVIENNVLGGLVVTTGGGPTKTLREAALHVTGFRYRSLYGITEHPDIVTAVEHSRARTEEVSSAMQNFTRSFFVDKLGVDVIYGSARLGPQSHRYSHFRRGLKNGTRLYGRENSDCDRISAISSTKHPI